MTGRGTASQAKRLTAIRWLLLLTALGVIGGWAMVFSASYPLAAARTGNAFYIAARQLLFIAGGVVLFWLAWQCPLAWLKRWAWLLHLVVLVLLVITLLFGKQRWLVFGPFQMQPSEFAKVTLVLALSALVDRWRTTSHWSSRWGLWLLGLSIWGVTVGLVLWQPHLSGGLILAAIGASALFFSGTPLILWLAMILLLGGTGCIAKKHFLRDYQVQRVKERYGFILPDGQMHYQSRQAVIGLSAGGPFGRGWLQSRQKHLFLPSAHNDFIFAVVGEEMGFAGSVVVLTFFTLLAYWGLWVAARAPDGFESGVAGGLATALWLQAMLHIIVNAGLLPPTGVPLPFVSAGGSSLWSTLLAMGLLVNVASHLGRSRKSGA